MFVVLNEWRKHEGDDDFGCDISARTQAKIGSDKHHFRFGWDTGATCWTTRSRATQEGADGHEGLSAYHALVLVRRQPHLHDCDAGTRGAGEETHSRDICACVR